MPLGDDLQQIQENKIQEQEHEHIHPMEPLLQVQPKRADYELMRTGTWEVMSKSEVASYDIETQTRYKTPKITSDRKKAMKKMLKDKGTIRRELETSDISTLAVWSLASVTIDEASSEFTQLSKTLFSFSTSYGKYQNASDKDKADAQFEKNDEAVNMLKAAKDYIALHNNERQFSNRGKNRMALAKYIVSKSFITKYLVEGSFMNGRGEEQFLSNDYTADSFIFEHMYKKANLVSCNYVKQPEVANLMAEFAKKYSKNGTDPRRQLSVLFTADESQNQRILDAMKKATEDPADISGIYQILDEKMNDILKINYTEEMFTKEFIMKNPGLLVHFDYLSMISADFFGNDSLYKSIGAPFMESLRKNHPEAAQAFDSKAMLMSKYGEAIVMNAKTYLAVSPSKINESLLFGRELNDIRTYAIDHDEDGDFSRAYTLEKYKQDLVDGEVEDKYYSTTYNFNRKKNRTRLNQIEHKRHLSKQHDFVSSKKSNDAIDQSSLDYLNYVEENDARFLIFYYVPEGSAFAQKLNDAISKDMGGSATDLDRTLAGFLKIVHFDALGDPLPEYRDNHQWNIRFIHGYAKALSNPSQRSEEYEKCLRESIEFATSDQNIKRLETICSSKSYVKNPDDMAFYNRMVNLGLKLFDNHIKKSKVAKPFLESLGQETEKIIAKLDYISGLGNVESLYAKAKYQVEMGNHNFEKARMDENSEYFKSYQLAFNTFLNDSKEALKKFS